MAEDKKYISSVKIDLNSSKEATVYQIKDVEARTLIGDNTDAIAEIASDYVKADDITNFETKENVKKVADSLAAYVESNNEALAQKANSVNVYTKTETFTKEEVNAAIAAAVEAAHTWGEF